MCLVSSSTDTGTGSYGGIQVNSRYKWASKVKSSPCKYIDTRVACCVFHPEQKRSFQNLENFEGTTKFKPYKATHGVECQFRFVKQYPTYIAALTVPHHPAFTKHGPMNEVPISVMITCEAAPFLHRTKMMMATLVLLITYYSTTQVGWDEGQTSQR